MSSAQLQLSKSRLFRNVDYLRSRTSSSFFCPMVKANAYGIGDSLVVGALLEKSVSTFGVARVEEGLKLRRFFPSSSMEILVFKPVTATSLSHYYTSSLSPVIGSFEELEILEASAKKQSVKLRVHLKLDLGMSRLGFDLEELSLLKDKMKESSLCFASLCGHFNNAGDILDSGGFSQKAIYSLKEAADFLGFNLDQTHLANSEAIEAQTFDMGLRPGISLYLPPSPQNSALQPALSLRAEVVKIRVLNEGQSVSYGARWTATRPEKVAIVALGYADGLRRALSGQIFAKGPQGEVLDQVGTICMDYSMFKLPASSDLSAGDEVSFFSDACEELYSWAEKLKTIPYELLTGLGSRIERSLADD